MGNQKFKQGPENPQPNNQPDRRKWMMISASIATASAFGVFKLFQKEKNEPKSEAQEFFDTFPESIPGASSVKKFPAKKDGKEINAARCAIFIEHNHSLDKLVKEMRKNKFPFSLEKNLTSEQQKQLDDFDAIWNPLVEDARVLEKKVNKDIAATVQFLVEEAGVDTMYLEAVRAEEEEAITMLLGLYDKCTQKLKDLDLELSQTPSDSVDRAAVEADIEKFKAWKVELVDTIRLGADQFTDYFVAKKLKIKAGDSREALAESTKYYASGSLDLDPEIKKRLNENREKFLLQRMTSDSKKIVAARYGGHHSLANNIQEHNDKEGSEPVCLIEIRPQSYTPSEKEIEEE